MNKLLDLLIFAEFESQPVSYNFTEEDSMKNIIKNYIYYPQKRFLEITR